MIGAGLGEPRIDVRGCLCMVDAEGLPLLGGLTVRNVPILAARSTSKLASRPGPITPTDLDRLLHQLAAALPTVH